MSTVYIQKKNMDATELDGDWVVLDSEQLTVTKLNSVGGQCWNLLKEPNSVDTLTQNLLQHFSKVGNELQVKKDVEEFLTELLEIGLVEVC